MTINLTIGSKRSSYEPQAVTIDWDKLPDASKAFVIQYGLKQYLADGVAGAESQEAFNNGIATRKTKLVEGTCGVRATGEKGPTNDPETLAKQMARTDVRETAKAKQAKLTKEQVEAAALKLFEAKKDSYLAKAKKEIEERKARAAEAAESVLDDILADVLGLQDEGEGEGDDATDDTDTE